MKITIDESSVYEQTEVIIRCKQVEGELLQLISLLKEHDKKIIGVANGVIQIIEPGEVYYFESVDKKSFVYTKEGVYQITLRLYEIEEMFKNYHFFRASKSSIINTSRIKQIRPTMNGRVEVILENEEKLVVSRQYVQNLKEILGF